MHLPYFIDGETRVSVSPVTDSLESTCMGAVHVPFPHQSPIKYMHALYFIDRETHVTVSPAGLLESTCMPQNQADRGEVHVPVSPIKWKVHAHPIVHWWWEMHVPVSPVIYLLESSCMPQTKWAAGSTCPSPTPTNHRSADSTCMSLSHQLLIYWKVHACPKPNCQGVVHVPVNCKVHAHPIVHWWGEMHVPVSPVIYWKVHACPKLNW